MNKERIYWIDQAKALGVLVVMLVHSPITLMLEHYLRSFSMPRFFIIAGLFLQLNQPFKSYCKNKIVRLVVPYLLFSFASYFVWLGYREITVGNDANIDPLKPFLWIFYANGGGNMVHNRPLWFLPSLFTTLMFVYLLNMIPKPQVYFTICLSAILGYLVMLYLPFRIPWSLDIMLTTSVLVMTGCLFRNNFMYNRLLSWKGMIFWSAVSFITAFANNFVRLSSADIGNFLLFYVSALAGTIVTLDLTRRIPYNRFLSYIGQHTLPIYALHMLVYLFLYEFFLRLPVILKVFELNGLIDLNSVLFQFCKLFMFIVPGLVIPLILIKMHEYCMNCFKDFKKRRTTELDMKYVGNDIVKMYHFL